MKTYFTSSVRLNVQNKDIVESIKSASTAAKFDFTSVYTDFSDVENYSKLSDDQAYDIFRRSQKYLIDSDVVIANVSHPSDRVGFEIANAISERKPVLALIHKDAKLAPPVQGNSSKYLEVKRYENTSDVKQIVTEFLVEARKKVDTKFILIISPEIDRYLNWAAESRRSHKAQIVRNAVEDIMYKDKEYQQYLKDSAL